MTLIISNLVRSHTQTESGSQSLSHAATKLVHDNDNVMHFLVMCFLALCIIIEIPVAHLSLIVNRNNQLFLHFVV